jgi:drug/metabolite transporter (DMT)-like permease
MIWVISFIYVNDHHIDAFSSNLSRAAGLILFNLPFVIKSKKAIASSTLYYLNIRHFLLTIYAFVFAQVQFYLPLSIVHTIYSSGPLFILTIDYFLHKITISRRQLTGVVLSFIGVAVTINGQLIYKFFNPSWQFETTFKNYLTNNTYDKIVAGLILVVFTLGWSYSIIIVKLIKDVNHF